MLECLVVHWSFAASAATTILGKLSPSRPPIESISGRDTTVCIEEYVFEAFDSRWCVNRTSILVVTLSIPSRNRVEGQELQTPEKKKCIVPVDSPLTICFYRCSRYIFHRIMHRFLNFLYPENELIVKPIHRVKKNSSSLPLTCFFLFFHE